MYPQTCNYHKWPGCCNNIGTKLTYKFYNENIDNIDVVNDIYDKIANKNITFLGDSLMEGLFEYCIEILNISEVEHYDNEDIYDAQDVYPIIKVMKHNYNGWIKNYKFYNLWTPEISSASNRKKMWIDEETFRKYASDGDIIILNAGYHYIDWTLLDYRFIVDKFASILHESKAANPHLNVFFRTTLPQHFITESKTGFYQDRLSMDCSEEMTNERLPTDYILMDVATKYNFSIFDEFYIYNNRQDLHSVTDRHDCTHYCYNTELAMAGLKLLTFIL